ncbi:MAG: aminotransferase class I/II-fold pyridoxal phosphate-dependent enzyme [Candidatus Thermoplasmatota archaeon]|nr:aminotransferase class I/II-fold pyridoxal phosphate-dependent enzyme [Candidatus Thermoplasmatota archaeon]
MEFKFAERINKLPPYLFAEIERITSEKRKQGKRLISLSIGDPDLPTPQFIIDAIKRAADDSANHKYSFSQGETVFREAVANWYKVRFGADVNPEKEAIALIGAKEGLANFARAFVNSGDGVIVPDPGYPVYANGATLLNEGIPVALPLLADKGFKPDFDAIGAKDLKKSKLLFLNYPNNPTGAVADKKLLKQAVEFASENGLILCYDNSYSEITFDGYRAPSILEIDGAKDVAIEFHSCSKTFNMTGDRIGFAAGNPKLMEGLRKIKSQIDSGPPIYIQKAAAEALMSYKKGGQPDYIREMNKTYVERRDALVGGLNKMGFNCRKPKGTFYVWVDVGCDSMQFVSKLIDAGVVATPGIGFGEQGRNFVRFAITQPKEKIREACELMSGIIVG